MQCLFPACFFLLFVLGFVFHIRICSEWLVTLDLLAIFNWGAKNLILLLGWLRFFSWSLYSDWTRSFPAEALCWSAMAAKQTTPKSLASSSNLAYPTPNCSSHMGFPGHAERACASGPLHLLCLTLKCLSLWYLNGLLSHFRQVSFQMPPCPRGLPLPSLSIPPSSTDFPYSTYTSDTLYIYFFVCLCLSSVTRM